MHNEPTTFAHEQRTAWRTDHPRSADDPDENWDAAWRLGAWHALKSNTDLGLVIAIQNLRQEVRYLTDTVERLERLATQGRDLEYDAEIEAQSAYWHTEARS